MQLKKNKQSSNITSRCDLIWRQTYIARLVKVEIKQLIVSDAYLGTNSSLIIVPT